MGNRLGNLFTSDESDEMFAKDGSGQPFADNEDEADGWSDKQLCDIVNQHFRTVKHRMLKMYKRGCLKNFEKS